MAGPVDTYVILPDDSGNTGKKLRAQSRVVGGNTVYEHMFVRVRQAQLFGVYRAALAQVTLLAAAQNGTATGFLWAHMPSAVTNRKARIRRAFFTSQHATALATPTAPRLKMTRFTFTGTASGASVTAAKIDASSGAPSFDLRTAVTGLTVSLVADEGAGGCVGAVTAVGAYSPATIDLLSPTAEEDEWVMVAPGEGMLIYQDTAGTASDTRVANINLLWDEIDTA